MIPHCMSGGVSRKLSCVGDWSHRYIPGQARSSPELRVRAAAAPVVQTPRSGSSKRNSAAARRRPAGGAVSFPGVSAGCL